MLNSQIDGEMQKLRSEFMSWQQDIEFRMEKAIELFTMHSISHENTIAMQEQTISLILSSVETLSQRIST